MDSSHPFSDAIRKGFEAVTHGVDEGVRRLKEFVEHREEAPVDDEFASMVSDLGADTTSSDDAEARLRIAQSTIEELRKNLENLQPIGDRFAEAEQARLALLDELDAARSERRTDAKLERTVQRLRTEVATRDRRIMRLTKQLETLGARHDERDRIAKERWDLVKRLRVELREAKASASAAPAKSSAKSKTVAKRKAATSKTATKRKPAKSKTATKRESSAKSKAGAKREALPSRGTGAKAKSGSSRASGAKRKATTRSKKR